MFAKWLHVLFVYFGLCADDQWIHFQGSDSIYNDRNQNCIYQNYKFSIPQSLYKLVTGELTQITLSLLFDEANLQ